MNPDVYNLVQKEMIDELPKLSTSHIVKLREDLKAQVRNPKVPQVGGRDQLMDTLAAISKELDGRVQNQKVADGTDNATVTKNLLANARVARRKQGIQRAARKLQMEKDIFGGLTMQQQDMYLKRNKNPVKISPEEYAKSIGYID